MNSPSIYNRLFHNVYFNAVYAFLNAFLEYKLIRVIIVLFLSKRTLLNFCNNHEPLQAVVK